MLDVSLAPDESFVEAAYALDHRLSFWAQATCTGPWLTAARAVTFLGSGWMLLPIAVVAVGRGPFTRVRDPARALLVVASSTAGLVALLKALVRRPRPFRTYRDVLALVAPPSDYSLPSGHATGAFVVASFIVCWLAYAGVGKKHVVGWGAGLGLVAGMIGATRVVLGVHYALDVAAGMLIGTACGVVGAKLGYRWQNRVRS